MVKKDVPSRRSRARRPDRRGGPRRSEPACGGERGSGSAWHRARRPGRAPRRRTGPSSGLTARPPRTGRAGHRRRSRSGSRRSAAALAESVVGDHGALAIHRALVAAGERPWPSVRTIAGLSSGPACSSGDAGSGVPRLPRGWYLSDVAAGRSELDAFDAIIDLPVLAARPTS